MKYVDEYRAPSACHNLLAEIRARTSRTWVLMDVCGGQTHGLVRSGIEQELAGVIELIHGPGCPVCVTPAAAIDFAAHLSLQADTMLVSFGDMLRVPGYRTSLAEARRRGGKVRIAYSPLDAIELAQQHPELQIVFFAVGFETTVPATALAVLQAEQLGLHNFRLLANHVRVQPAMEAIMRMPDNRVQGFLAAGHVCTVTGAGLHDSFAETFAVPVAVTGFEPVDLLQGILACVRQLEAGQARVENCYGRSVRHAGNLSAQAMIDRVYEVADANWRGFGLIPQGGFRLRAPFARFDAHRDWAAQPLEIACDHEICRAGEVMSGKIKPRQCSAFGTRCTPQTPLGAPMVSSEGACAAYFRYQGAAEDTTVTET